MADLIHFSSELALDSSLRQLSFDDFMSLSGRVVRQVPSRQTSQIQYDGQSFFIKKHLGVGWAEIFKNLLTGKLPIISAKNEWDAINKVTDLGMLTTPFIAYGQRGSNPGDMQSFLLTADLGAILSLEDICKSWLQKPPALKLKRKLIRAAARVAAKMHEAGIVHRDFYICHICFREDQLDQPEVPLYVIDLHRARCLSALPDHLRIKDIAALYSSAMHIGLTRHDLMLFAQFYWGKTWFKQKDVQRMVAKIRLRARKLDEKLTKKRQQHQPL